ncbi:long-chain-fatty-acid--CoA ligase [Aliikangiella maris]|uniref:Long-chain-fatty-acid--CoA ligase n=2 Tax=Aliikangiella maris TaxID=3162458 RepID=A0ABV3MMI6_9GAMM
MIHFAEINTLAQTLPFHAERTPEKLALVSKDGEVTYQQLNELSGRAANALLAEGIPSGSRVAYLGKESQAYFELIFACAKTKNVIVPINWRLTSDEVKHILSDSESVILVVDHDLTAIIDPIKSELKHLNKILLADSPHSLSQNSPTQSQNNTDLVETTKDYTYQNWRDSASDTHIEIKVKGKDAVAQLYTSGTTGLPKGVVLPHQSYFKVRDALQSESLHWIDWQEGDNSLIGIPGFHVGGLWWSAQGFNAGITNISIPVFSSQLAIKLIKDYPITTMCVVPAMIQMILSEKNIQSSDFHSLRKVVYGGSPIGETLLSRGIEIMDCDFAQIYGLTETGNTAVCLPPEAHQIGSELLKAAGRPYPGFALKIIDSNNNILTTGEVGEVCIKTPSHMLEYWKNPKATFETLVDGWIHTGDAGYLNAAGYLFICDRIKDTIIVAGENVYPAEIENALGKCDGVVESAVIGIPDERWGEAILAFIVFDESAEQSIRQVCLALQNKLASFKIPTQFKIVDKIPRNASGKILRRILRDEFWKNKERMVN